MNFTSALSLCVSENERVGDLIRLVLEDDECFDPMPVLDVRILNLLLGLIRNRNVVAPVFQRLGLICVSLKLLAKNRELASSLGNIRLDDFDTTMDKLLKLVVESWILIGKTAEGKPLDSSLIRECNNFCFIVKNLTFTYTSLHKKIMDNGLIALLQLINKNMNVRLKNIFLQLITQLVRMEQIEWSKEFMDPVQAQLAILAEWVLFKCGDYETQMTAMAFICLLAPTFRDDRRQYAKDLFGKRRSICKQFSRFQFRSYNGSEVRHFMEMINDTRKMDNKLIYSLNCTRMIVDGSVRYGPILTANFSIESKITRAEYFSDKDIRHIDIEADGIENLKIMVRESTEMDGSNFMIFALVIWVKRKYVNCTGDRIRTRKVYLIFNKLEDALTLKNYVIPLMYPEYNTPETQGELIRFMTYCEERTEMQSED